MSLLGIVSGGITTLVGKWFDNKGKEADHKHEQRMNEQGQVADYDTEALRQKQYSWSDEYLMLIHTLPWWGYLIPSETLTDRLDLLWSKMHMLPDYWWFAYIGMVISTFGLRFMHTKLINRK